MTERSDVLRLDGVAVQRAGRTILGPIDWTVRPGERWVVFGPNGSGKTTLLQVASTYLWPSMGRVSVLGQPIGAVDARTLREVIGYAGSALERAISDDVTALDVVMTARHAALAPWWHRYTDADCDRAGSLLGRLGIGALADHSFGTLSTGERRRVQIARALMPEPTLLLLDEPGAGLDLGARESLVEDLAGLAGDPALAAIVLVSHHVEEIPTGFGHALILLAGRAVAAGPIATALASGPLSAAFGRPLVVERSDGRFTARGGGTAAPAMSGGGTAAPAMSGGGTAAPAMSGGGTAAPAMSGGRTAAAMSGDPIAAAMSGDPTASAMSGGRAAPNDTVA